MKYNEIRRKTRKINIGTKSIGGDSLIAIQSMTNVDSHNIDGTISQIRALQSAGCDIVRLAVPDIEAADTVRNAAISLYLWSLIFILITVLRSNASNTGWIRSV